MSISNAEMKVGLLVYLDETDASIASWACTNANIAVLGNIGELVQLEDGANYWETWFPACNRTLVLSCNNVNKVNK